MLISKIQQFNISTGYIQNGIRSCKSRDARYNFSPLDNDTFVKADDGNNIDRMPHRNVSFLGGIANVSNAFETKFTKVFFKKLLREGIPDAYSDIILIPNEDIDALKSLGVLKKKSSIAIKYLKPYRDNMFPVEKEVFSLLETLSKKNPDLTLQELIQLKYKNAEQSLINHQSKVLNKISQMSKVLPKNEFLEVRKLLQSSYNKMFIPEPLPENRFGRKDFIYGLRSISIADPKMKQKMLDVASLLPQSADSAHAFIVKYSQPYKIVHNKNGEIVKIPRDSEEIGLRLLMPSVGTDDHIHPQKAFRAEEAARRSGDESAQNLSRLKVSILTSKYMNELKSDTPIDDFINSQNADIPANIQAQIAKLIEIADRWCRCGNFSMVDTLCDYIKVLQKEFELRSSKVKIDLGNFEERIPVIKEKVKNFKDLRQAKRTRMKKCGHADNCHKDQYVEKDGRIVENRKVLKHSSRFQQ